MSIVNVHKNENLLSKIITYFRNYQFYNERLNTAATDNNNKKIEDKEKPNPIDFFSLVDQGYIASWDKKTGTAIKKRMNAVRNGLITENMAFSYLSKLDEVTQRKYEDKTIDIYKYDGLVPLQASYKFDKLTNYGLALFCALIAQKNVTPVTHMAAGEGIGLTEDYSDLLIEEKVRYRFSDDGYINSLNKLLRFHMTFDILEETFAVREIGLFNTEDDNTGPMISRTVFDPAVEHVYGENYFTGSYIITTLSA